MPRPQAADAQCRPQDALLPAALRRAAPPHFTTPHTTPPHFTTPHTSYTTPPHPSPPLPSPPRPAHTQAGPGQAQAQAAPFAGAPLPPHPLPCPCPCLPRGVPRARPPPASSPATSRWPRSRRPRPAQCPQGPRPSGTAGGCVAGRAAWVVGGVRSVCGGGGGAGGGRGCGGGQGGAICLKREAHQEFGLLQDKGGGGGTWPPGLAAVQCRHGGRRQGCPHQRTSAYRMRRPAAVLARL